MRAQARIIVYLLLPQILLLLSISLWKSEATDTGSEPESVTIKSWEFCEGCKQTVNLFSRIFAQELSDMNKKGVAPFSAFEAGNIINLVCDNSYFEQFVPSVKYSCINLMDKHRVQILEHFTGNASAVTVANKAQVFERKKHICISDAEACKEAHFKSRKVITKVSKKKTKCSACMTIGDDIHMIYRLLKDKKTLKDRLEDDFCDSLGYNHSPYTWLESVCDEIVEEKLDDVIDVFKFYSKVASTGLTPSQSFPEMMCSEFYKCSKDDGEL